MLCVADTFQQHVEHLKSKRPKVIHLLFATSGKKKPPNPPVGRIGAALNQSGLLKAVDHPACRDRLDLKHIRKAALIDTGVPMKNCKHLPLRTSYANAACPLIETAPYQA